MQNRPIFDQTSDISTTYTVPWTPRDVFWGLVMAFLWIIAFIILSNFSQKLGLFIDSSLIVVIGTLFLLIPVWYFTIHKYQATWADLGLRRFQPQAVGIGCGLMFLSLLFNLIYATFLGIFNLEIQPDIDHIFDGSGYPFILLLGGAIVAPIVEEIFFRGFVFAGLRNRWDWKIAALMSGGIFAMVHILPTSYAPIFILALIFAFLYQISGSIWPAILMHMLTNTIALSAVYVIS